ncbi:FtsX-like permease family protein [uncultured Blautia sp.]
MLKNNNQPVIKRIAKTNLKSNFRRSITMILAVLLSSFLLFSVFTVGLTYLKMNKLQNIRLNGADFDAVLYGVTEEQQTILDNDENVKQFGILTVAGAVRETETDKTPGVGLLYADAVLWDDMMSPTRTFLQGKYPTNENEIMVTEEALKKCGFENKKTGDEITFVYEIKEKRQEKTFQISGIWGGFGIVDNFFVSKAFCEQEGIEELYNSRCDISFEKRWMSEEEQQAFIDKMELGKSQRLFYVYEFGNAAEIFWGIAGIVVVTCLSAYLLIYNIMYLSVAGNIRYYGLLQTIGMTGKQIRSLIKKQMIWIGGIGISLGLFLGFFVSFSLIPVAIESLGMKQEQTGQVQVVFHPAVFLLTILLTGFSVWYAARKPIRLAESSSPIEALGYRPVSGIRKGHTTKKGNLIRRMAVEQLTRNKKKTVVTMLSLSASLSVFVCLMILLHTQSAREYVYNFRGLDMVVANDTIQNVVVEQDEEGKKQLQGVKQILNQEILDKIKKTDGVSAVFPVSCVSTVIPWEPEVSDVWMREFYETWMDIPYENDLEEYKNHPENFASALIGITEEDFRALNQELNTPVDETSFLKGETCILYRNGLFDLDEKKVIGKNILCGEYENPENTRSFEIVALTDINDYTALLGYPPTMIVIDKAVSSFAKEPIIFKVGIQYEKEFDERAEAAVENILRKSPNASDFSWESKIIQAEIVEKAQGHMAEIGFGIVAILAVIGIMNYINTSVGNVQSRRKEISIMESVGMSEHQVRKMLVWEGIFYTGGVMLLTLTAGLGITYAIYQSVNYMGAAFWFPMVPFFIACILLLTVCIAVPLLAYKQMEKSGSLVERIRVEVE